MDNLHGTQMKTSDSNYLNEGTCENPGFRHVSPTRALDSSVCAETHPSGFGASCDSNYREEIQASEMWHEHCKVLLSQLLGYGSNGLSITTTEPPPLNKTGFTFVGEDQVLRLRRVPDSPILVRMYEQSGAVIATLCVYSDQMTVPLGSCRPIIKALSSPIVLG